MPVVTPTKSGHTCAPFNLYHGSRVSTFNERPRPHTSRWNGSPVSSSSASRTAAPCGAFRFVPRPRGSAIVASHVTNLIKVASRHFARRRTTSLSPNPAKLIVGVFARCWAARAHRARRCSAVVTVTRSENHALTILLINSTYFIIVRGGAQQIVQVPALDRVNSYLCLDPTKHGEFRLSATVHCCWR